jgi:hypothetical protein
MIIKITSYDVHVRRSYFNRQNSQLFNQRIPYGQRDNTIGCFFFFFFFLFHLKVGVHTFLHEWCIHSQLFDAYFYVK